MRSIVQRLEDADVAVVILSGEDLVDEVILESDVVALSGVAGEEHGRIEQHADAGEAVVRLYFGEASSVAELLQEYAFEIEGMKMLVHGDVDAPADLTAELHLVDAARG